MPEEDWNDFVESMVSDIMGESRFPSKELVAFLFIRQKWWGRLLKNGNQKFYSSLTTLFDQEMRDMGNTNNNGYPDDGVWE